MRRAVRFTDYSEASGLGPEREFGAAMPDAQRSAQNPYLRQRWTKGRIGGRTRQGALILLGIALVYIALFGEAGWIRQMRLETQKKELVQVVQDLEAQERALAAEAWRLKTDPEYREKVAREQWGYVEPGEEIYQVRYTQ